MMLKKRERTMPKKAGIAIMAAGAVLIISALLLFVHNRQEDAQAGQEAESLLESVEAVIEAQAVRKPSPSPGVSPSPAGRPDDADRHDRRL